MSNMINSQNTNINNVIPARKIDGNIEFKRFVEAPQSLPKYSIDKILNEKDEFRRNLRINEYEKQNKKKSGLLKLGVILAAITGFFLLKGKK